jgi:hypothetical protein
VPQSGSIPSHSNLIFKLERTGFITILKRNSDISLEWMDSNFPAQLKLRSKPQNVHSSLPGGSFVLILTRDNRSEALSPKKCSSSVIYRHNYTLWDHLSALPYRLSYCCIVPAATEKGGAATRGIRGCRVGRREKGDLMGNSTINLVADCVDCVEIEQSPRRTPVWEEETALCLD